MQAFNKAMLYKSYSDIEKLPFLIGNVRLQVLYELTKVRLNLCQYSTDIGRERGRR